LRSWWTTTLLQLYDRSPVQFTHFGEGIDGAKYNSDVIEGFERKQNLIEAAILILEECLALAPEVRKYYVDAVL
jgi:hypothetical protein